MDPHWHVAEALLISLLLLAFRLISLLDLVWITALTLAVDFIDHGLIIYLRRSSLARETISIIKKGEWRKAYEYYRANRLGAFTYMYLHNLPFVGFLILTCLVIYGVGLPMEPVFLILFGLVLHLLSDFIFSWTRTNTVEHLKFWTLNPIRACHSSIRRG